MTWRHSVLSSFSITGQVFRRAPPQGGDAGMRRVRDVDDLTPLVTRIRNEPALRAKLELDAVADILGGDGDDAGLISIVDRWAGVVSARRVNDADLARDPARTAYRGVVSVLGNMAASGARAMGLLNTISGPPRMFRTAFAGVRAAADAFGVPVLGGDTAVDGEPSLSVFAVGWTGRPLSSAHIRPGDELVMVTCDDVTLERTADGLVLDHLDGSRASRAAADLDLIPSLSDIGAVWAARDISRAGLVGSVVQLLESAGSLGVAVDLDALIPPGNVTLEDYLVAAQTFGFILSGERDRIRSEADAVGLACRSLGVVDDSGVVRLRRGEREVPVWDLTRERLTGLRSAPVT